MNGNSLIEHEENSNGKLQEEFIKLKGLPEDADVLNLPDFWTYVEEDMQGGEDREEDR